MPSYLQRSKMHSTGKDYQMKDLLSWLDMHLLVSSIHYLISKGRLPQWKCIYFYVIKIRRANNVVTIKQYLSIQYKPKVRCHSTFHNSSGQGWWDGWSVSNIFQLNYVDWDQVKFFTWPSNIGTTFGEIYNIQFIFVLRITFFL